MLYNTRVSTGIIELSKRRTSLRLRRVCRNRRFQILNSVCDDKTSSFVHLIDNFDTRHWKTCFGRASHPHSQVTTFVILMEIEFGRPPPPNSFYVSIFNSQKSKSSVGVRSITPFLPRWQIFSIGCLNLWTYIHKKWCDSFAPWICIQYIYNILYIHVHRFVFKPVVIYMKLILCWQFGCIYISDWDYLYPWLGLLDPAAERIICLRTDESCR